MAPSDAIGSGPDFTKCEAPTIIGTCINCISPGSLSATLALVLTGAAVALAAERRQLARMRADK
jgi:hypothetical protein